VTRCGILSTVASLYDPIGIRCPLCPQWQAMLQDMCRQRTGWDDPLQEELHTRWECWTEDLANLEKLTIPRCYHPPGFGEILKVELHHFSDASTTGSGQCSYRRLENKGGVVYCSLVMGKSWVAPTKVTTIPRLELSAAVVSVKASNMLRE